MHGKHFQFSTYLLLPIIIIIHLAMSSSACGPIEAVAVLTGANGETGTVRFHQSKCDKNVVVMNVTISGLSGGLHGFHVHEKGDLSGGCDTLLAHYNPLNKTHGAPSDTLYRRHVGDFGNVHADQGGIVNEIISDRIASLCGDFSIIGRGIVVHKGADDLGRGNSSLSLTTGNSGPRAACGIIGRA